MFRTTRSIITITVTLAVVAAGVTVFAQQKAAEPGVSLTVYNGDFAVVRERRMMDLKAGRSVVRFSDVASGIEPESVIFEPLSDGSATKVLEQNYEFDLVNAWKLLDKFIDREVSVVTRDGRMTDGVLMSSDDEQLVLKRSDGRIAVIPRLDDANVKEIILNKMPEGLLTKPTLVWHIESKKAGRQLVMVSYITKGMTWQADYTMVLSADEKTIDWSGWVTVTNNSGTSFRDAQLKLMAGDIHRTVEEEDDDEESGGASLFGDDDEDGVEEKSFAEYHLYTVGRPTTLNNRQTKQIEFIAKRPGVRVEKEYYVSGWRGIGTAKRPADVYVKFKNEKKNGMGMPLPGGTVRIFKRDADGELQMLGEDGIGHTPKDEELELYVGEAADVVWQRKVLATRKPAGKVEEEDIEVRIRNHRNVPVTVNVSETMRWDSEWELLKESATGEKTGPNNMLWPIKVDANSESKLTYTVRYSSNDE